MSATEITKDQESRMHSILDEQINSLNVLKQSMKGSQHRVSESMHKF